METLTTIQARALARTRCAEKGVASSWVASANRAALDSFLAGGDVPVAASPAPAGADIAGALASVFGAAASGAVDALRAEVTEELLAIRADLAKVPGDVATVGERLAGVERAVSALGGIAALAEAASTLERSKTRLPIIAAAAGAPGGALAALLPYYRPGQSNGGTVVCLTAPPSYGKSWAVRQLAESYTVFLEHPCTSDTDEAARMLGTLAPDGKGGFVTVDGSLTQAVRSAARGEPTLLFLDEIFRLSERVAETLLTFFVPHAGEYRLRTRRPAADGNGWEYLTCPVDNLHVVCAANLGPVPPLEALWSRLKVTRLQWSLAAATETAAAIIRAHGIDDAENGAARVYAQVLGESRAAFAAGTITAPLDFRHLERACRHADSPNRGSVMRWARTNAIDQIAAWHPDTGDIRAESEAVGKALVSKLSV